MIICVDVLLMCCDWFVLCYIILLANELVMQWISWKCDGISRKLSNMNINGLNSVQSCTNVGCINNSSVQISESEIGN